jgi:uncharacterized protein
VISIDVRDLVGHPGTSRNIHLDQAVEDLRLELAAVPGDAPIEADLLLEGVVEGIFASGLLRGAMRLSCARCLKAFDEPFDLAVNELFVPQPDPNAEDYPLDPTGEIDIEPLVRDAVMLAMPFSPLCRPDCLGLCERCGGDRNLGECTCAPAPADPRWSVLENLTLD